MKADVQKRVFGSSVVAVAAMMMVGSSADASIVGIVGNPSASTEGLGNFSGTIEYNYDMFAVRGLLQITLTNTSSPANGGFLTGFVFNINSVDASRRAVLASASFPLFLDTGTEAAPPFGSYDAGAALGAHWTGGGSPAGGIGVGQTGVFNFNVTASDAASLTAMSFITGPNQHNFVVRFRGFADGGSDKVPGRIPAPGALALLALGGLVGSTRRRR